MTLKGLAFFLCLYIIYILCVGTQTAKLTHAGVTERDIQSVQFRFQHLKSQRLLVKSQVPRFAMKTFQVVTLTFKYRASCI